MLDAFLHAARTSKEREFAWHRVGQYASGLFHEASPRTLVLVLPHLHWDWLTDGEDLIWRWAVAVHAIPYTEEVAQSVVDTLLQIASKEELLPCIPIGVWSWLTKCPSLPPICLGRYVGTCVHVVKAVQALEDIEILKSYFLLVWSEWNLPSCPLPDDTINRPRRIYRLARRRPPHIRYAFDGFSDMQISIREDFGGIGMGHHRADLLRHLDHVLGQLDRGLEYLKQHNPQFDEDRLHGMKDQYQNLRELLLETIGSTSSPTTTPLRISTPARMHAGSHTTFMCALPLPCP
jgi:hypothetical protein